MVDFTKLMQKREHDNISDPVEIFRGLPKPQGINDLYSSQAEVLTSWYQRRENKDTVIKLHTGGGKTLVGLLMAQSSMNEGMGPVLYLTPTNQLVDQTLQKARDIGIPAVSYEKGKDLDSDFKNGKAVLVASYSALFNGKTKFGLKGNFQFENVGTIILDDAHTSFNIIRDAFTIDVESRGTTEGVYKELCHEFRVNFQEIGKGGTFDDIVNGKELQTLEVPYWAWKDKLPVVRRVLGKVIENYTFEWPLLRDSLEYCYALINKNSFTITPIAPFIDLFPTFTNATRRIYMSATIADDSDIIETFDISKEAVEQPLRSDSLAGVSERMILIPSLTSENWSDEEDMIKVMMQNTVEKNLGAIILSSSNKKAQRWSSFAHIAKGSQVGTIVDGMQNKKYFGPVVFVNRYDGIDLPGDSCRLLIMDGLPIGTSNYEMFKTAALMGSGPINKMIAQRVEQGLGRASRGTADNSVNILIGRDLVNWISQTANMNFLTGSTYAQIEIGKEVSQEVDSQEDLWNVILQSYGRDLGWTRYHSETLASMMNSETKSSSYSLSSITERKALQLWKDGLHDKAITKIRKLIETDNELDDYTKGWLYQLAAKIAYDWNNSSLFDEMQRQAYIYNPQLNRPKTTDEMSFSTLRTPIRQAEAIVMNFKPYRNRRGLLSKFESIVSKLTPDATAYQFEAAFEEFGKIIGFSAQRFDENGVGADVIWLLSDKKGIVFEAKSEKKPKNALTKGEHGQLLVAGKWVKQNYPSHSFDLVSIHPSDRATVSASAESTQVLTYDNLERLICDSRLIIKSIAESQLPEEGLTQYCEVLLAESHITENEISSYFVNFQTE